MTPLQLGLPPVPGILLDLSVASPKGGAFKLMKQSLTDRSHEHLLQESPPGSCPAYGYHTEAPLLCLLKDGL
jgi:hypothetical protein